MNNKLILPSKQEMIEDIKMKRNAMKKRFDSGEHDILLVEQFRRKMECNQLINAKPNLLKYFFTDPKLWSSLLFGPSLLYQYRLALGQESGSWRETILTVFNRIEAPFKTKNKMLIYQNNFYEKVFLSTIMLYSVIFIILNIYFWFEEFVKKGKW